MKFEGIKKRQNSWATINLLTFFSFPVLIQEYAISFTPYFPHLTGCPSFTKTTTKNQGFLQGNNTDNWDAKIFSLVDKIKIKDFLQSEDPIILSEVFLKLDHQPDSKWQSLGLKLGMEHDDLQQIKIDCANQNENPARGLIEYIYRRDPTMTMAIFKKHLTNIQRNDVEYKLDSMKGVFETSSHNCNIIHKTIMHVRNGPIRWQFLVRLLCKLWECCSSQNGRVTRQLMTEQIPCFHASAHVWITNDVKMWYEQKSVTDILTTFWRLLWSIIIQTQGNKAIKIRLVSK